MALRIKRGTDAERQGITPDSGEPVWTIDTKKLYIGDGSTAGGVLVTGAEGGGSLTGIDDNTTGVVLTLADSVSTFSNDVDLDVNDLILSGGEINGTGDIDILGNITASGNITANSVIATVVGTLDGDVTGSVFGDDSTLIVDSVNNEIFTSIINHDDAELSITPSGASPSSRFDISASGEDAILKAVTVSTLDLAGTNARHGRLIFARDDSQGFTTVAGISARENGMYLYHSAAGTHPDSTAITIEEGTLGIKTYTPNTAYALDVRGDADFTGDVTTTTLTAGAVLLSGSNIDTSDSSAITVTPGVTFNSDVTVENSMTVSNTLTVDTLEVTNFQTVGVGTPELESATDILLTAGTRVEVTSSPLKMASFTTTERNALTPENGDIIYNTTDNKFQGYENGAWANLI